MIPLFKVHMPESVFEPLKAVLMSGYIGQGPKVDAFEKALVPWVGTPNCLTVNSGTSALHLAMRLAGVERGTEVITSPMTCTATNEPILERGADIVWADIDPWTGNIDPLDVERKITSKTRAIIAVHWGGYPCEIDELLKVARKYNLALIEDAAHSFGSMYKGRPIGSSGAFVAFSFQAIKLVTTVDGGLLVCPSTEDYRRGKLLRWFGIDRETPRVDLRCENDVAEFGYKMHLSDVLATIGLEQLKYTKGLLDQTRANAKFYDDSLGALRKIKRLRYEADRLSSYWLYTIRVNNREGFQAFMKDKEITVSQVHVRNDVHTAFKAFRRNLPGVDEFTREQVSIPVGWWIGEKEREQISDAIHEWDRS
jgi:dTDP-4-amino-4,6-dideoxygalactose transaminase